MINNGKTPALSATVSQNVQSKELTGPRHCDCKPASLPRQPRQPLSTVPSILWEKNAATDPPMADEAPRFFWEWDSPPEARAAQQRQGDPAEIRGKLV